MLINVLVTFGIDAPLVYAVSWKKMKGSTEMEGGRPEE